MSDKEFHLCKCKDPNCQGAGIIEYYRSFDPENEEPFWVTCPQCQRVMAIARPARTNEVETLPKLTCYGRHGILVPIRPFFWVPLPQDASPYNVTGGITRVAHQDQGITENQVTPANPDKETELLSCEVVAKILDCHPGTVRRMAARNEIPAVKIAGKWKIPRKTFFEWLDSRASGDSSPMAPPADPRPSVPAHARQARQGNAQRRTKRKQESREEVRKRLKKKYK